MYIMNGKEEILNILEQNIKNLNDKYNNGRVRNKDNEKVKVQQFRALVYACDIYLKCIKTNELDELKDLLELIANPINTNELSFNDTNQIAKVINEL